MLDIHYNESIQPKNIEIIEACLVPYLWLVPGWVHRLHINMTEGQESGERLAVRVNYDYREVSIDFCTNWLNESDDLKRVQVVHELLHIHLSLIADFARDKINLLVSTDEAPKFNESLQDDLRERHESATCDLAHAIALRFPE